MKKLIYISIVAFLAIGCGGGSSGVVKQGKLIIQTDAQKVAYSLDDSAYSTNVGSGKDIGNSFKEYSIDSEGRYKVALYCGHNNNTVIIASTMTENNKIRYTCKNSHSMYLSSTIQGNIKDTINNADSYVLAVKNDFKIKSGNNPNYSLQSYKNKPNDLVAISIKNNEPKRFYIQNYIVPTSSTKTINIDFKQSNSAEIKSKNFTKSNSTDGSLILITKNSTYFTSSLSGKWYYPNGMLTHDDIYLTKSYINSKKVCRLKTVYADTISKNNINIDASDINQLSNPQYSNSSISGLSYAPTVNSKPFIGYAFDLEKNNAYTFIFASKAYLNGSSSFNLDDLTTLQGFSNSWSGSNATNAYAVAIMTNSTISELLKAERSANLSGVCGGLPLLPNATIEIASKKIK